MAKRSTAGIRLQGSDLDIFQSLIDARYLTATLLASEFGRHRTAINRRLKRLEEAGYVRRRRTSQTEEDIWHATAKARKALVDAGRTPAEQAKPPTKSHKPQVEYQRHESHANMLRNAFLSRSGDHSEVEVVRFVATAEFNRTLRERDGTRYTVRPDRFLHLRQGSTNFFYLIEVDRGTKDLETNKPNWQDTAGQLYAYLPYYQRGCFAEVMAGTQNGKAHPRDWPFRVLVTVESRDGSPQVRRTNMIDKVIRRMKRHHRRPPVSASRGYAVFEHALSDPYGAIWLREIELYPILKWLAQQPVGRTLQESLPHDSRYERIRELIGDNLLGRAYKREARLATRCKVVHDHELRDALIEALLATQALRCYSILDQWPPAVPLLSA